MQMRRQVCSVNRETNQQPHTSHQTLLTSSLLSTLLHPHLLPQGVEWYEVDGAHARVDPRVSTHVDQAAGAHARRQDGLPWNATEIQHLGGGGGGGLRPSMLSLSQGAEDKNTFFCVVRRFELHCDLRQKMFIPIFFCAFKSVTKLIKGFFPPPPLGGDLRGLNPCRGSRDSAESENK